MIHELIYYDRFISITQYYQIITVFSYLHVFCLEFFWPRTDLGMKADPLVEAYDL